MRIKKASDKTKTTSNSELPFSQTEKKDPIAQKSDQIATENSVTEISSIGSVESKAIHTFDDSINTEPAINESPDTFQTDIDDSKIQLVDPIHGFCFNSIFF